MIKKVFNLFMNYFYALIPFSCGSFFLYWSYTFQQPSHRIDYLEVEKTIRTTTDVTKLQELLIYEINYAKHGDDNLVNILFSGGGLLVISSVVIFYLVLKQSKYSNESK